ncbi:MAG: protein kinase [Polyangiaceae bacterium]|nr:protein kinase [Polyangiaceae bacterium]
MAEIGRIIGGRFRIDARAGSGGGSIVYRATDTTDGATVALKLPHAGGALFEKRFEREISILADIDDARVVRHVAHGRDPEAGQFLAMEWLEGETLSDRLHRAPLDRGEAIALGVALAETLARIHDRGVIHRDLKPSNVLLADADLGRPKLLDFGIARSAAHTAMTNTGALLGTAGYMSPEQVRGDAAVDHRTDIFSLGCVVFQCVTGRLPFDAESPAEWLLKLALEQAPRADAIHDDAGADLADILEQMLQKRAANRLSSMSQVVRLLSGLRGSVVAGPKSVRSRAAITESERRFASVLLVRGPIPPHAAAALAAHAKQRSGLVYESPDGVMLVVFGSAESPTDAAQSATLVGTALVDAWPAATPIVLSTRMSTEGGRFDEAIGRATSFSALARPGAVLVDDATRRLLGGTLICEPATSADLPSARAFVVAGDVPAEPNSLRPASDLFGREREISALVDSFRHVTSDGAPEVVLVLGVAGAGKSRVVAEARARMAATREPPTILVGSAENGERTESLGLVRSMLRRHFSLRGKTDPAASESALHAAVAELVAPSLVETTADFLAELLLDHHRDVPSAAVRAARAEPRLMSDQLVRAVELVLRAIAASGPAVLCLEQIHWADEASIALFDRFIGSCEGFPVLLIGAGRPETLDRFPKLFADRPTTTIQLRALSPKAGADLVASILGPGWPSEALDRLVALGGGNPLFLRELAYAAREGGARDLPETALALAQSRLDRLGERDRRILRAASVFGARFSGDGLAALLGGERHEDALSTLVGANVLRKEDDASDGGRYAFQSAILREAAYASIPDQDLARAHVRAAEQIEKGSHLEPLEIAFHFEAGGARQRAAPWYLRAGRWALETLDLTSAQRWAERALACDEAPLAKGAALVLLAEVDEMRWDWTSGKAHATAAMELLPVGGVLWFIAAHVLILSSMRSRDIAGFYEHATRISLIDPAPEARNTAAHALGGAINSMGISGHAETAEPILARVEAYVATLPEGTSGHAYVTMGRGGIALGRGDLGSYRTLRYEAAERFEALNDWRRAVEVRGTAGYAEAVLGRYDDALATLEACVARAVDHGMTTVHYLRHNIGFALMQMGRFAEARTVLEAVLTPLETRDVRLYAGSLRYLSRSLVGLGELDLAERHARAALERADRASMALPGKADLAHVLLARAGVSEAYALAEEAAAGLSPDGAFDECEMFIRLTHARACRLRGDMEAAKSIALAARDRLDRLAGKIQDPSLRASFVGAVPEHTRILKLAGRSAPPSGPGH